MMILINDDVDNDNRDSDNNISWRLVGGASSSSKSINSGAGRWMIQYLWCLSINSVIISMNLFIAHHHQHYQHHHHYHHHNQSSSYSSSYMSTESTRSSQMRSSTSSRRNSTWVDLSLMGRGRCARLMNRWMNGMDRWMDSWNGCIDGWMDKCLCASHCWLLSRCDYKHVTGRSPN